VNDPKPRTVVDSVSWGEIFRFHRIFSAIIHAMHPPRLVVGLLMVIALMAGGQLWDAVFEGEGTFSARGLLVEETPLDAGAVRDQLLEMAQASSRARRELDLDERTIPENIDPELLRGWIVADYRIRRDQMVESGVNAEQISRNDREFRAKLERLDAITPRRPFRATAEQAARSFVQIVNEGVFGLRPNRVFDGFADLFVRAPIRLWEAKPWFVVFYGLFALIVISVGGGALCRMSATEVAGRERLRVADAFDFATRHWVKLVLVPLLPLIVAGIAALVLMLAGFVLFLPVVNVIGAVLYGLGLVFGFLIAFFLILYAASFLMFLPAVAVENCSPADAMQRAFAYLLSRPLHLLGYATAGLAGLAIGYIVVALFATTTLNVTGAAASAFTESPVVDATGEFRIFDLSPTQGNYQREWHEKVGGTIVAIWQGLIVYLVIAYVVSFMFSASTVIYMLMRKLVDEQDYSEIWRPGLVPGTLAPMPTRRAVEPAAGTPAPAASGDAAPGTGEESASEPEKGGDASESPSSESAGQSDTERDADEGGEDAKPGS